MAEQEQQGTYRALPEVDDDILGFILNDDAGPVRQFTATLADVGAALARVDEEMLGLSEANDNLTTIVRGTVEGLYNVFSRQIHSEQDKAMLRVVAHINAFVVLRALDMQWRRVQAP